MKTQLKINGELKDVEIENGEITVIETEKKQTGWERAKKGTGYICISVGAGPYPEIDSNVASDNVMFRAANYFTNEELAENISRMQTIQRKLFRWQAENDEPPILVKKGNKDPQRWRIGYNPSSKEFQPECYYKKGGIIFPEFSPVFSSSQKVIECIKVFKDELTWLFTEFKWRMDG